MISLKVGINLVNADSMTDRTFGPALHGFLDQVRDGHPDTPILLVSPIHCPSVEDHPGPNVARSDGTYGVVEGLDEVRITHLTLRKVRAAIEAIVDARRAAGDANLHYLDGLTLFGPDDVGDLPDLLHPNPAGYRRIGERFAAAAFGRRRPTRLTVPHFGRRRYRHGTAGVPWSGRPQRRQCIRGGHRVPLPPFARAG